MSWPRVKADADGRLQPPFCALYQQLKAQSGSFASLRMDKHRTDSVGPNDLRFTLLDDYLHVVDTALWLSNGKAQLQSGTLLTSEQGEMVYAEHHFAVEHLQVTTSMHRRAGSQRESVQAVTDGALYDVTDMREWREEKGNGVVALPVPGWQSTGTAWLCGLRASLHHLRAESDGS